MSSGRTLIRELSELFLPAGCLGCGERIPPEEENRLVCPLCRGRLVPPPPPTCPRCQVPRGTGHASEETCLDCNFWPALLRTARAAVTLGPSAGALVHALKYRGWSELAGFMAEKMARESIRHLHRPILVPVPTTRWRRRTRGYNQAGLLARALGERWSLPVTNALGRRGGRTQVHMSPRQRRENVQGSFHFHSDLRSRIRDREVILIDDVLTTGATALSAVGALATGEPAGVHLRTFARALPFSVEGATGDAVDG